jgi:transcriptional regulator
VAIRPWHVSDAPEDYVQRQLTAIVGFEIPIGRATGKWKLSQNRNEADRAGVASGLAREPDAASHEMETLMNQLDSSKGR